jgi:hypothetical protein
MSKETSSQCDPPLVHCFLNGRCECECGAEHHDEVLAEILIALTRVECQLAGNRSNRALPHAISGA